MRCGRNRNHLSTTSEILIFQHPPPLHFNPSIDMNDMVGCGMWESDCLVRNQTLGLSHKTLRFAVSIHLFPFSNLSLM